MSFIRAKQTLFAPLPVIRVYLLNTIDCHSSEPYSSTQSNKRKSESQHDPVIKTS